MKDHHGLSQFSCIYFIFFLFAVCFYLHRLQLFMIQPSLSNPSYCVETDFWVSKFRTVCCSCFSPEIPILLTESDSQAIEGIHSSTLLSLCLPSPLTSFFSYFTCHSSTHVTLPGAFQGVTGRGHAPPSNPTPLAQRAMEVKCRSSWSDPVLSRVQRGNWNCCKIPFDIWHQNGKGWFGHFGFPHTEHILLWYNEKYIFSLWPQSLA